ncbi:MAG TPA: thioredoxin domain-containing protein [Candidatus Thermoplasmatota archaeon]|nr:thioredoxin domain-containing protein [Candidatus Thermoplasmatota archaeon]
MPNRLAGEPSSYLRSAAHQPVHWRPWSSDAFAEAKAQDKPILLDIGAVWCHWCHVMDRESYENEDTARLINERYIAVKVDRDERPDVDTRYQKSVQAMTGQGGWPLTAFLLPDGRCFYGGTYYPPIDAHGRPSFTRVLQAVSDAYRDRHDEIHHNADALQEHLASRSRAAGATSRDDWDGILTEAVVEMRAQFDVEHGGWGRAPKFPHATAVDFLLTRPDPVARDMAISTLRAMRDGGVYDQLAGGSHRYSVDASWIVPHFEKMLYDNAALLRNYVRAWRATGDEPSHRTAREIAHWLRDVLQQPDGGFGGSQDADVGLEDDGDFFTWTQDELRAAIPDPNLAKLVAAHYGVREAGDMHHNGAKCVLRIAADADALAAAFKVDAQWVHSELARGRGLMREARAKRATPFVDPLRYTSWNAMAIQALLELAEPETDAMALRALDHLLAAAFVRERGWARTDQGKVFGLLDDNAQMLDALLEAHLATGDRRYLDAARATADLLLARFAHPEGGFADRAPGLAPAAEGAPLSQPERPLQDAPTASGNGVALRALLRLADATGEERYHAAAMDALGKLAHDAAHLNLFGGALLLAMDAALRPAPRVVARVKDPSPWRQLTRRAPGATFALPDEAGVPPEARAFPGEGAMVCVGTRCLAPARTPEELAARLAEARQGLSAT